MRFGRIDALVADTAIFIGERPKPAGTASHLALAEGGELGQVENEDYVCCLLRFARRFLQSIADGRPHGATVEDAVHSARAIDCMVESAHGQQWVRLPE